MVVSVATPVLCGFLVFTLVFYCVIVNKFVGITLVSEFTGKTRVVPSNVA